jgi:glycosyltransferase involved in cell wall biosynthesis
MTLDPSLRVALVHERFTELGGSEKVVDSMAGLWPAAQLFSPVIDRSVPSTALRTLATNESDLLRRLYGGGGSYAHLLPLLPGAMRRARLPESDVVVVSHHAFGNRVRVATGVPVVSYVHTPARWLWDADTRAMDGSSTAHQALLTAFAATQRHRDRLAAQRPDVLIANSSTVADRIDRWWGRNSVVVHPPVAVDRYRLDRNVERESFFLLAGRLVPYKRPEVAIRAANEAGVRMVVAGEGRARTLCESVAGPNVTFLGAVTDRDLHDLYQRCQALVFPGVEDFGIVPVEAQACGAPVLGRDEGGLRDTVIPDRTGSLIPPTDDTAALVDGFAAALAGFSLSDFDPVAIRANAERFSEPRFHAEISELVQRAVGGPGATRAQSVPDDRLPGHEPVLTAELADGI